MQRTSRAHRPDAHLRRTAPSIGPGRVRRALQPAQAAPVPPATTTRSRRPGRHSAGPAGPAAESARRRDQRVLPGGVTDLMNPKVRHHASSFEAVHRRGAPLTGHDDATAAARRKTHADRQQVARTGLAAPDASLTGLVTQSYSRPWSRRVILGPKNDSLRLAPAMHAM